MVVRVFCVPPGIIAERIENCEIGRVLHFKSEIRNLKLDSMSIEIPEDLTSDSTRPPKPTQSE
jgi:hypothetical protein